MARYKLRVPGLGTVLYGDTDTAIVADTRESAREFFEDESGEPTPYLHSYIGSCRVAYKRDIEAGDCHEDAEPGDTTVDYLHDSGRELRPNECRVWMLGPPPLDWRMEPLPQEPISPDEIPVGTSAYHKRIGSGKTASKGYAVGPRWFIDIAFQRFERGRWVVDRTLACSVATIGILPGLTWPRRRYRLTVAGEHVADGYEDALQTLRDVRIARLDAEWEAEQDRLATTGAGIA